MFHCPCPIARRNVLGCRTTTFVNHEVAPGVCELRCPCPPTTCKSWCTSFGSLCLACPSRRPPVCKKRIWVLKKPVYEYSFVLIALCGVVHFRSCVCVARECACPSRRCGETPVVGLLGCETLFSLRLDERCESASVLCVSLWLLSLSWPSSLAFFSSCKSSDSLKTRSVSDGLTASLCVCVLARVTVCLPLRMIGVSREKRNKHRSTNPTSSGSKTV